MNVDKLLEALEDDQNESLLNFTTKKIQEMTFRILKELHLPQKETVALCNKLKHYKYIDEIHDLKYGTFLRWIPIDDPNNIELTRGAIFCEIKINENGVFCLCKSFGFPTKYFQISIDTNLIFQKLTEQELVLLNALDHLST
jgi:hypothetical protein